MTSGDIDNDGDLDLFIGERVKIGSFGAKCSGFILVNDGKGVFNDQTQALAPELSKLGMITDAVFADFDGDKMVDLLVVGEFMPITIFKNNNGKFDKKIVIPESDGWWNRVKIADINGDGKVDMVVGNHGLNSRFKATVDQPLFLYHADYDANGYPESVMSRVHENGKEYPVHLRHSLIARLPGLKKKFPDYKSFQNATMNDIFSEQVLSKIDKVKSVEMQSCLFINKGNIAFEKNALPVKAQTAPIFALHLFDIDNDGDLDILTGGNLYEVQPEFGRYDANYGNILINDGKGRFIDESAKYLISVPGVVRDIISDDNYLHYFRSNNKVFSIPLKRK